MLAEPKRKIKWTLNPRGNFWSKDNNKYGQKLLEKMGWQSGKGLGKLENGQVDHIRVAYKNDNNGIGWDEKTNGWVSHQNEFDTLLANLNSTYSKENICDSNETTINLEPVTLEQRAKTFRSRMHYQKFLHVKDVSQYSQKDIESIFGKKLDASGNSPVINSSEFETKAGAGNSEATVTGDYSNYNGVTTFKSSTSIADYFTQKLWTKKRGQIAITNDDKEKTGGDQDNASESLIHCEEAIGLPEEERAIKKKKKKSKKKKSRNESCGIADNSSEEKVYDIYDNGCETSISCDISKASPAEETITKNKHTNKRKWESEDLLIESEITDLDCGSFQKHKKIDYSHIQESCFVSDSSHSSSGKGPNESSLSGLLKSCMKEKGKCKPVHKKCVTFNEQPSCYDTLCETGAEENNSADIKQLNLPVNTDTTKLSVSNSSTSALLNDSTSVKANSLWVHNSFALGQFPINQSMVGRNNDSWNVTLKLAEKMDHYASVIKNIQQHEILSTTNLLSIKGYGN